MVNLPELSAAAAESLPFVADHLTEEPQSEEKTESNGTEYEEGAVKKESGSQALPIYFECQRVIGNRTVHLPSNPEAQLIDTIMKHKEDFPDASYDSVIDSFGNNCYYLSIKLIV